MIAAWNNEAVIHADDRLSMGGIGWDCRGPSPEERAATFARLANVRKLGADNKGVMRDGFWFPIRGFLNRFRSAHGTAFTVPIGVRFVAVDFGLNPYYS